MFEYDHKQVYIAFGQNIEYPFFHLKQLCKMFDYKDYRDAIRKHIKKEDIFYLKDIVVNYQILYKNVKGHTKFTNEPGLYDLIMKKALEIQYWVTHDVLPSLRKYGTYKLLESNKNEITILTNQINLINNELKTKNNRIAVLEHNMRTPKYDKGSAIYVGRVINDTLEFNVDEEVEVKIGKSKDLNVRKNVLNTTVPNKIQYIKTIYVKDKEAIETCVRNKLANYLIQANKDYLRCSYNILINEVANCVKFFEGYDIDKTPDIFKGESRLVENDSFDLNDSFDFVFVDVVDDIDDTQLGGNNDNYYKMKYLKYKIKYLTLLDELN